MPPLRPSAAPLVTPRAGASRIAACALAALGAAGCKRDQPPPPASRPSSTPTAEAPAGPVPRASLACPQDLGGVWVNASDRSFAYAVQDEGELLRGNFFHRAADGGALPLPEGEEPMALELHRTRTFLAGVLRTVTLTPKGRRCPAEFGLEVSSCTAGADGGPVSSLQVQTELSMELDDDCHRRRDPDGGLPTPDLAEYVLVRP